MKKINLFATLLAVLSFAFFACERPEQSEMDLSNLTDTATISGALVYDAGVDTAGSADQYVINQFKPVANRTVFVEVPYSSYNFNGNQEGSKIFETTTDAQGNFSIEIPTTSNGLRNVTIRMQEFTAYRSEYKKMEGSSPVFETDMYRYTWVKENVTLKPGSIEFMKEDDRVCQFEKVSLEELKETITLVGNIQLAYEAGFRKGIYKAAANATVEFEAEYPEGFDGVLTAGTVTDAQGNYRITLPLKSYKDGFSSLNVKVLGLAGDPYVHYSTATDKQTLAGAYVAENILSLYSVGDIIEGMEHKMKTMYLRFTPGYTNNLANSVSPSTYTDNLVGWEKYDGYTETVTISGKYLLATSNGYGLGTYTNTSGEGIFYVNYGDIRGDKYLFAPVNADGTFSFELPVTDKEEKFEINSAYYTSREYRYTHYKNEKETIEIGGTYSIYVVDNEIGAEWNNLGTTYLKFTPSSTITTEQLNDIDWNPYLVGWVIDPNKKEKATISANLYFPTEKQFGVGSYAPATTRIFTVEVNGVYYAAPISEGKFQLEIPVKNSNEQFDVHFGSFEIASVSDYIHYTSAKGDKQTLNGKYVKRAWIGENKADRKAWNELGDIYFQFKPADTYDKDVINWNDNLADWHKSAEKTTKLKVSANINFAAESAFGKALYKPATDYIIEINDGEFTYAAPVKNGKYEVNILAKDANAEPNLNFLTTEIKNVKDYTHYVGTTTADVRKLEGAYNYYLWDGADAEKRVSWADLGNVYYRFTPASTYDLAKIKWNNNLVGWIKSAERTQTRQLYVDVNLAVETSYAKGKYEPANGLLFEITDGYYTYAAPAENGKVTFDVLVKDEFTNVSATWNPSGITYSFDEFVHYYDGETGKTRKLEGYYSDYVVENRLESEPESKLWTIYLKYVPNYSSFDLEQMNWFNNLAGWVANAELKVSKTVTGSLYRAVETGFYSGSYIPAAFEVVTVEVNGIEFVGATDVDGNYSIDVRMKYDEMPSSYSVTNRIAYKEYEFEHYRRPNTQDIEKIAVRYGNSFTNYKENIDAWYNRRATYYRVVDHSTVDFWSYNIPGWINQKYKIVDDYNKTLTVKGVAKRAVEKKDATGNWIAQWENDKYRMIEVEILGRTYSVVANSAGNYSVPVAVENIETDYTNVYVRALSDLDDDNNRVKFIHYPEVDKTTQEVLVGHFYDSNVVDGTYTYTVASNAIEIKEPCVKSLFQPISAPLTWSNYDWISILSE